MYIQEACDAKVGKELHTLVCGGRSKYSRSKKHELQKYIPVYCCFYENKLFISKFIYESYEILTGRWT